MTTIGADLSRYDPDEAAAQYPFVILNVEDPRMANKADIAQAARVPIMLYSWVYPGDEGRSLTRSYAAEELLALDGIRVLHHWLDYEQAGVRPSDLAAAGARVRNDLAPVGTYAYLAMIEDQGADFWANIVGPLWIAYYPGDSTYQDHYSATARRYGAVMHQFTSTNGTRDLNVVLDPAWWARVSTGDLPGPDHREEDDMVVWVCLDTKTDGGKWAGAWIQEGSFTMFRKQSVNDIGPGRSVSMTAAELKVQYHDVQLARQAAGLPADVS